MEANRNKFKLDGKKAIEIGWEFFHLNSNRAGCGLTGIALAFMGAHSILTDLGNELDASIHFKECMVPLLKKNINLNNTPGKLTVQDLDWTKWKEVAPKFKPPYDIVVGLNSI